jgi:hypothetical protein
MRRTVACSAAIVAVVCSVAMVAQEKKIARRSLPPAVEKTVAEESRGATIKGFSTEVEQGRKTYEMALIVNGHGKDVSMDARGHVLEIEEEVIMASLPAAVQTGLKRAARRGILGKVESLTKKGKLVAYEAVVIGKKHRKVQVGPDGRKLAHPE